MNERKKKPHAAKPWAMPHPQKNSQKKARAPCHKYGAQSFRNAGRTHKNKRFVVPGPSSAYCQWHGVGGGSMFNSSSSRTSPGLLTRLQLRNNNNKRRKRYAHHTDASSPSRKALVVRVWDCDLRRGVECQRSPSRASPSSAASSSDDRTTPSFAPLFLTWGSR